MAEKKKMFLGLIPKGIMQAPLICIAVLFTFFLILNMSYEGATEYSSNAATAKFAECLTEKNAVLYGSNHCSHCNTQKILFGEYFEKISFVNCDETPWLCEAVDITAYPTWIINGKKHLGTESLTKLKELTGCGAKT